MVGRQLRHFEMVLITREFIRTAHWTDSDDMYQWFTGQKVKRTGILIINPHIMARLLVLLPEESGYLGAVAIREFYYVLCQSTLGNGIRYNTTAADKAVLEALTYFERMQDANTKGTNGC